MCKSTSQLQKLFSLKFKIGETTISTELLIRSAGDPCPSLCRSPFLLHFQWHTRQNATQVRHVTQQRFYLRSAWNGAAAVSFIFFTVRLWFFFFFHIVHISLFKKVYKNERKQKPKSHKFGAI